MAGRSVVASRLRHRAPGRMEALFLGQVIRDQEGCLRVQAPDDATVVWPHGFSLESRSWERWVVDAGGEDVGVVGGPFRFGGGLVPYLHSGLDFSEAEVTEIHAQCPGRYWIVGSVLTP